MAHENQCGEIPALLSLRRPDHDEKKYSEPRQSQPFWKIVHTAALQVAPAGLGFISVNLCSSVD